MWEKLVTPESPEFSRRLWLKDRQGSGRGREGWGRVVETRSVRLDECHGTHTTHPWGTGAYMTRDTNLRWEVCVEGARSSGSSTHRRKHFWSGRWEEVSLTYKRKETDVLTDNDVNSVLWRYKLNGTWVPFLTGVYRKHRGRRPCYGPSISLQWNYPPPRNMYLFLVQKSLHVKMFPFFFIKRPFL